MSFEASNSPVDAFFNIMIRDSNGDSLCYCGDVCNQCSVGSYSEIIKVTANEPVVVIVTGGNSYSLGCPQNSALTITASDVVGTVCSGNTKAADAPTGSFKAWTIWEDTKTSSVDCSWDIHFPDDHVARTSIPSLSAHLGYCKTSRITVTEFIPGQKTGRVLYSNVRDAAEWDSDETKILDITLSDEWNIKTTAPNSYIRVQLTTEDCKYLEGQFFEFSYTVMMAPNLLGMFPHISYHPSQNIFISGSAFYPFITKCMLSSRLIETELIDATTIACKAFADGVTKGSQNLTIVNVFPTKEGPLEVGSLSTEEFQFIYEPFTVIGSSPRTGPSLGSEITIKGSGFSELASQYDEIVCVVSGPKTNTTIVGTYIDSETIKCPSQPLKTLEEANVDMDGVDYSVSLSMDYGLSTQLSPHSYKLQESCYTKSGGTNQRRMTDEVVCSGHGICLGGCLCFPHWYGDDCHSSEKMCKYDVDSYDTAGARLTAHMYLMIVAQLLLLILL